MWNYPLLLAAWKLAPALAAPAAPQAGVGDDPPQLTDYSKWSPQALEAELNRRAIVEKKVLDDEVKGGLEAALKAYGEQFVSSAAAVA